MSDDMWYGTLTRHEETSQIHRDTLARLKYIKFFVPAAKDSKEAESVYASIKQFAQDQTGWKNTDRRIFSLAYQHEGKQYFAEVDKSESRGGEVVVAILESRTYLVCTPNRGVVRGGPILVGKDEVLAIQDFVI